MGISSRTSSAPARSIPHAVHDHHTYTHNHNPTLDTHTTAQQFKPPTAAVSVSLLQPRVAVVLGIPKRWHRTLSICRLLSVVPCVWWGLRLALRFLVAQVLRHSSRHEFDDEASLRVTETLLAGIWV
jgi:hypothetical protein